MSDQRQTNDNVGESQPKGRDEKHNSGQTRAKSKSAPSDRRRQRHETSARAKSRGSHRQLNANKRDALGLYPIHWAALNNRCDQIERLLTQDPQSLRRRCTNRLFANGTPIHLAAMNGSLEAASLLLIESRKQLTGESATNSAHESGAPFGELLEALDSDGQTPLMRTAAPRTRKWSNIRELLQKNFWSLPGRAAEMALFLIALGADWRKREPVNGMNLLHLAIMNDYDDIVSLLLVLDRQLINEATLKPSSGEQRSQPEAVVESERANGGPVSPSSEPLIDSSSENAPSIISRGIRPLELAVLYGRVKIIGLLWRPRRRAGDAAETATEEELANAADDNQADLKRLLVRACFSDNDELVKFLKPLILKALLAVDLVVIALVWAPAYCLSVSVDAGEPQHRNYSLRPSLKGGVFFISYCLSLGLTLRVMLRNPGFLRRHSVHYLSELVKLLRGVPRARDTIANKLGKKASDNKDETPPAGKRTSTSPLIRLDDTTSILVDNGTKRKRVDPDEEETDGRHKITTLAIGSPDTSDNLTGQTTAERVREIQYGVRYLCHRCQCIRRPRSRHCNYCDHCVQDFDHHCIYLGCCIGRNNRLDFLLAMIALTVTSIYGTILQSVSVNQRHREASLWHLVAFVWIFKYALIGGTKAFCLLRRACLGVTLYEEARSRRLRDKFGRRGPPKEISRTYATLSTLDEGEAVFWRYLPYDSQRKTSAGGQQRHLRRGWVGNLREFANYTSPDEYLLALVCTDTPLTRSLLTRSSDLRIKQQQQQQLHKPA